MYNRGYCCWVNSCSSVKGTETLITVYSNILIQVDCFHPSLLMHELMTKVMWNCMFTPQSEKNYTFNFWEPLKCPTEDTIFYTY